jgi:putative peptidoglycan lipid II flippase
MGVLAKAAMTVRELAIAQWFGRGDALDAFLIAFLLPSFAVNLIMGALAAALIPVLVETRHKQDQEATDKLLSSLAIISVIALAAIALVLGLFARYYLPYLGSNFSPEKLNLTRELLYALLPWIVLNGMAMFVASVLNAGEKFALPAMIPVVTPLVTILSIAVAAPRFGAFSIAAGTVAGSVLEILVLLRLLKTHGTPLHLRWAAIDDNVRGVLRQSAPMIAGTFLMGSTTVVDKAMAAMLPGGSVAALNYGNKIAYAVVAIGATALSTAVLPYFSKMVTQGDWAGCRHTLKRYSMLVVASSVPFTFLLIIFSKALVKLLFQRGAFTAADTQLVSSVQICYAIQIPFYIWGMLFVRFLTSVRRNDLLMYASAVNLGVDIVLNLILMRYMGVAGIALSTSLVYLVSCTFVAICTMKILGRERLAAAAPMTAGSATR